MVRCVAQEENPHKGCVWGYPGIPGGPGLNGTPDRGGRDGLQGDKGDQGKLRRDHFSFPTWFYAHFVIYLKLQMWNL